MTRFNANTTPELATSEHLAEKFSQFDRIAAGAQADVLMLTEPQHSTRATPDHEYVIPRVAKIALGQISIGRFVREKIGLEDPYEIASKITELQHDQLRTHTAVYRAVRYTPADSELHWRLGHPEWLPAHALIGSLAVGEYAADVAYSQDYAQPAAELFAQLKPNSEHHRALAQHIFDQYITIQRLLVRYGLFDTSFKLLDNYGVDEDGNLILLDFSELTLDRAKAERSIRAKEWEDLPNRREQTHLAASFQKAFNETLAAQLTPAGLSQWGTAYADPIRRQGYAPHRSDVSSEVIELMIHQSAHRKPLRHTTAPQRWLTAQFSSARQDERLTDNSQAMLPELDCYSQLPKQFAKIGQGAQYRVYMLTHPWLSHPTTPDAAYTIPRVIKHALTSEEARAHIRDVLRIRQPEAQLRKLAELQTALSNTLTPLFTAAIHDNQLLAGNDRYASSKLYCLLGCPTIHNAGKLESGDTVITSYSQDYAQPVADLLPQLNWKHPEHQRIGRSIVDQYVDLQLLLIEYGYFDDIFKLANNCGVDDHATLSLLDPGELTTDLAKVMHAITHQTWRNIPGRPEYDDLPTYLQNYLNQQLERRLTPEVVAARWQIRKRPLDTQQYTRAIYELLDPDIGDNVLNHVLGRLTP